MRLKKQQKMKLAYNFSTMLVLLMSLFVNTAYASDTITTITKQEYTKSIKKDFGIFANGTVSLFNKYGKMDIKTWDKNRVKVDIRITVNSSSESDAQEVFDRITFDFSNGGDFVKAETQIASKNSSWWSGWGDDNETDFNIDYEVYMPPTATLDLSNKYGDVYVAELARNANINVKYGNFRLDGVGENLNVTLGYGNGTVVKAARTEAKISYSKFRMQEGGDVNFDTKYSKIGIDKASDIRVNSSYDTYDIGRVRDYHSTGKYDNVSIGTAENITAVSKYTDFAVGSVKNSADFDLTYGGARIEKIANGFSEMRLSGRYADYKVRVEPGTSYQLDASANYAGIRYPSPLQVTYEKDQGTSHHVEGYVNTKGARSVIKANLSYGGLKVD
ncbi:MAG: hypothetical protein ACI85O_003893 [Saprospiraceae bacterium]|jgi:hypothetical protein